MNIDSRIVLQIDSDSFRNRLDKPRQITLCENIYLENLIK